QCPGNGHQPAVAFQQGEREQQQEQPEYIVGERDRQGQQQAQQHQQQAGPCGRQTVVEQGGTARSYALFQPAQPGRDPVAEPPQGLAPGSTPGNRPRQPGGAAGQQQLRADQHHQWP